MNRDGQVLRLLLWCRGARLAGVAAARPRSARTKVHDASNYNMQLGMAYLNRGDLGLAKEKLDRAMAENPGDPNVHSAMAMLQDRLGHPEKADTEFSAALSLGPRNPDDLEQLRRLPVPHRPHDEGVKASRKRRTTRCTARRRRLTPTRASVCAAAKRDTQAAMSFQRALQVKPKLRGGGLSARRPGLPARRGRRCQRAMWIDFSARFEATADLLLLGVRIARKQGDRLADERFARKLRLDFPGSDQARALAELDHNPG